jgi:hypothetical protein
MSEILIDQAPINKYRPYLQKGDEAGDRDGMFVNDDDEANFALKECLQKEGESKCQKFLEYLEASGFQPDIDEAKALITREKKEGALNRILSYFTSDRTDASEKAFKMIRDIVKAKDTPESDQLIIVNKMIELLGHYSPTVRERAAIILEKISSSDISPEILTQIVDPAVNLAFLSSDPKIQEIVSRIIINLIKAEIAPSKKTAIFERLSAALRDFSSSRHEIAENILLKLTSEKLPSYLLIQLIGPCLSGLDSPIAQYKITSLRLAGVLTSSELEPALKEQFQAPVARAYLGETNPAIKYAAAEAYAQVISDLPKSAQGAILEKETAKLSNPDQQTKLCAAIALSKTTMPQETLRKTVQILLATLSEKDSEALSGASKAFGNLLGSNLDLQAKQAIADRLIGAFLDPTPIIGVNATSIIIDLIKQPIPIELKTKLTEAARNCIRGKDFNQKINSSRLLVAALKLNFSEASFSKILDSLSNGLTGEDETPRSAITEALTAETPNNYGITYTLEIKTRIVEELTLFSENPNPGIRESIAKILGYLASSDFPEALADSIVRKPMESLKDSDPLFREYGAGALSSLSASALPIRQKMMMIDPLITVLKDRSVEVARYAVIALGNVISLDIPDALKEKIIKALLTITTDKNEDLSSEAIQTLKEVSTAGISQKLIDKINALPDLNQQQE